MLPEDVNRIPLPTPFQVGDVNTYLLRGTPLTLVDAGPLMEESEARLEAGLAALGVAVADLELLCSRTSTTTTSASRPSWPAAPVQRSRAPRCSPPTSATST